MKRNAKNKTGGISQIELDALMARHGYSVAYHGTAGRWKKPWFGSPHGVPAFYLSVEHGPAESYAALRALSLNERPRVMKFYVCQDNVLVLQEDGGGAKSLAKDLRKAKVGGYDAVMVKGALDDQYYRLGKRGEIIAMEEDEAFPLAAPADIFVVLNPEALVSSEMICRRLRRCGKRGMSAVKTAIRRSAGWVRSKNPLEWW
jgi:hypothetical protein